MESVTGAIGLGVSPASQVMPASREHDLRYQKAVESCNGGYRARSSTCFAGDASFQVGHYGSVALTANTYIEHYARDGGKLWKETTSNWRDMHACSRS